MLNTKYKWQSWTFYASYQYIRQQNPSDTYMNGFETIGYFNVPGTLAGFNVPGTLSITGFTTQWAVNNAYNIPTVSERHLGRRQVSVPAEWMHGWGALDLTGAYYWLGQNDYNFSVNSQRRDRPGRLHHTPSPAASSRTGRRSRSRASTAASAPARRTSSRSWPIGVRSSASTSTPA